jgi:hypothetical protein
MMATRKKTGTPAKNPNKLELQAEPGKTKEASLARYSIDPPISNVVTVREYAKRAWGDELHISELAAALNEQARAAKAGDLSQGEAMLMVQAHTLDAIFNNLAQRAALNFGEYLDAGERYLRLALKAQSQCRATLETLATIKNPPIVYAKQANVTTGPQQVNNGIQPQRAREIQNEQTQLSGEPHELLPDAGTPGLASRVNQEVEALGEIDRA